MNKQEQKFALVAQWRESGLSRRVFAQMNNISLKSLDYWCRKHSGKIARPQRLTIASSKPDGASPGFIELSPEKDISAKLQPIRMEFELPGGIRIKIY